MTDRWRWNGEKDRLKQRDRFRDNGERERKRKDMRDRWSEREKTEHTREQQRGICLELAERGRKR